MNYEKYLPLGSVVLLKKGKHRISIIGFCFVMKEAKRQYDYVGVFYPEGFAGLDNVFLFDHDDIKEVYSIGYSDEKEKKFKHALVEAVKTFSTDEKCHYISPEKYDEFQKKDIKYDE